MHDNLVKVVFLQIKLLLNIFILNFVFWKGFKNFQNKTNLANDIKFDRNTITSVLTK